MGEAGFAHLRRAIELDDALPYDEPWGWMQPTRHAYGALLLEQGRVEEAAFRGGDSLILLRLPGGDTLRAALPGPPPERGAFLRLGWDAAAVVPLAG